MKKLGVVLLCVLLIPHNLFARSLEEIQKSGGIRIGTVKQNFIPTYYLNAQGERTGIDHDLMTAIAREMGVKLEVVLLDGYNERMPALLDEKIDLAVAAFSVTEERLEKINFSIPYLITGVGVMVQNQFQDAVKEFDDLVGHTVSTMEDTTLQEALEKFYPETKLLLYTSVDESWDAFVSGKAEAFSYDELFLHPLVKQYPGKYYVLEGTLTADPYGVGVNKKYPDLLEKVNAIIATLEKSGELARIINAHSFVAAAEPVSEKVVVIHTVVKEDTLSKIAYKYYKNYAKWRIIYDANKDVITYPNVIQVGMQLKIPDQTPAAAPAPQQAVPTPTPAVVPTPVPTQTPAPVAAETPSSLDSTGIEAKLKRLKELYDKDLITKEVYEKQQMILLEQLGE